MALFPRKKKEFEGDPIRLEGVGLRYGNGPEIFSDLTLSLPARSLHFLTGPSGAGKTSLLSLLYLSNLPSRGAVSLFGHDVTAASRAQRLQMRRRVGVVFQDFRLLDHLSAFDNVALPLRVAGVKTETIQRDVTELLTWVGLDGLLDAKPQFFRVGRSNALQSRAVVNRPAVILADEPTGNVDDDIAVRLMQLFVELHKLGSCVIVATHNESLVRRFPFPRLHLDGGAINVMAAVQ